jgi:ABC-2 type transport system permease protein
MIAMYKKELRSYFTGMTGFVFIGFLLLMAGIFVTAYNLLLAYASLSYAIGSIQLILMLTVPILTTRILAEERRNRTDQLLYALPIPLYKTVLAKYLAMLTVFLIPTVVIALYPLILSAFGSVPLFPSYASPLGFFLLGAALIALCMFLSALTDSQVIAAVISFGAVLFLYLLPVLATMIPSGAEASLFAFVLLSILIAAVLYFLSQSLLLAVPGGAVPLLATFIIYFANADLLKGVFPRLLTTLAIFDRFETFIGGIFDLSAIVYFLSIVVFFVFLTVQVLEKRRYL